MTDEEVKSWLLLKSARLCAPRQLEHTSVLCRCNVEGSSGRVGLDKQGEVEPGLISRPQGPRVLEGGL